MAEGKSIEELRAEAKAAAETAKAEAAAKAAAEAEAAKAEAAEDGEEVSKAAGGVVLGTQYMDKAPVMWRCPECNKMNPKVDKCRYCGAARPE